jgi:hypothetical protein
MGLISIKYKERAFIEENDLVIVVNENQPKLIIFLNTLSIDHFNPFNLVNDDNFISLNLRLWI